MLTYLKVPPRVQVQEIVKLAPRDRQTMLFSATMTDDVQKLVSMSLRSPVRLAADAAGQVPDGLLQEIIRLKVRISTCLPPLRMIWLFRFREFSSVETRLRNYSYIEISASGSCVREWIPRMLDTPDVWNLR